jgi:hypothetical protein
MHTLELFLLTSTTPTILFTGVVRAEKTDYYFDQSTVFDSKIPGSEQYPGYEIGTLIAKHHRITTCLEKLAGLSKCAEIIEPGRTHEGRSLKIQKRSYS